MTRLESNVDSLSIAAECKRERGKRLNSIDNARIEAHRTPGADKKISHSAEGGGGGGGGVCNV